MTDEDTRTGLALRDRLTVTEPPLTLNPGQLRAASRARLRSRRWAAASGAIAVVTGVALGGWALDSTVGQRDTPVADKAADFSPDKLVAAMQASVSSAQSKDPGLTSVVWQMQDVWAQVGPTSKMLAGDERIKADRWQARFSDGGDHLIDIVLIHEGTASIESLQQDCSVGLASRLDDVCAAAKTSTGTPYQYIERAAYQMDESWPTPNDPSLPEPVPADQRWYLHQVKVFNPDGLTVVATEVVHSAASTTAASQWTLTHDQLLQIASDPLLTFPRTSSR
jgi:hypothetical protein